MLFVATKKQAKDIVAEKMKGTGMPFVTERWSGGMLTNFGTIRRTIKKMTAIDRMKADGTLNHLSKRERLQVSRQREKMEKNLGSIADLTRLPSALFIVDIVKEHIALAEAQAEHPPHLRDGGYPAIPRWWTSPILANDDATKSIELIVDIMVKALNEGMEERRSDKARAEAASQAGGRTVTRTATRTARRRSRRPPPATTTIETRQRMSTMAITASDVNKLRQMTGAGMMDCKSALTEANGDFDAAVDILRKKGQKVAAKAADREANEGYVVAEDQRRRHPRRAGGGELRDRLQAKNADFVGMAERIVDIALEKGASTIEDLKALPFDQNGLSIAEARGTDRCDGKERGHLRGHRGRPSPTTTPATKWPAWWA